MNDTQLARIISAIKSSLRMVLQSQILEELQFQSVNLHSMAEYCGTLVLVTHSRISANLKLIKRIFLDTIEHKYQNSFESGFVDSANFSNLENNLQWMLDNTLS